MNGENKGNVLVVDDDIRLRKLCTAFLQREGYSVATAENAEQALEQVQVSPFDLVLTDLKMPGMSGIFKSVSRLQQIQSDLLVIIMSGSLDPAEMAELATGEMYEFLEKPFNMKELQDMVGKVLER